MNKKVIYLVYIFDSHKKVLKNLEYFFIRKRWKVRYVYLNTENIKELDIYDISLSLGDIKSFFGNNIIMTAIGGRYLNYIKYGNPKATIVALYPGIIVDKNIEDLITKSTADILLLNSKKDRMIYDKIALSLGIKNNSILYGAGWYKNVEILNKENRKDFLFIEQSNIPNSKYEREELVKKIYSISIKNRCKCYIKMRIINGRNKTPNKEVESLDKIVKKLDYGESLKFIDDDLSLLIHSFKNIVGISTSALLEAILAKKNVYILSDFGDNRYFVDFFKRSGLCVKSEEIRFDRPLIVNKDWYLHNVSNPYDNIENIYSSIVTYKKKQINNTKNKLCFLNLVIRLPLKHILEVGIRNLYIKCKKSIEIIELK